jgi:hypothetical protein
LPLDILAAFWIKERLVVSHLFFPFLQKLSFTSIGPHPRTGAARAASPRRQQHHLQVSSCCI